MTPFTRRDFLEATAASAALLAFPRVLLSDDSLDAIQAEILKRHAEGVQRLQDWIRQPSIAAEKRGMAEGCKHMMRLAHEAGFQQVAQVPTDGSSNPKVMGWDGAVRSYVDYLYELASIG